MPPAIEARALTRAFGPHVALAGVDLCVAPGESLALVGPNGAGKTTLLRILATLSRPTAGDFRIFGLDPLASGALLRGRIGFLSHRPLLYEDLTAEENLAFYARLYRLPGAHERARALLVRVGLSGRRRDLVRTYSRGMQQRLALARALLHAPDLLLLDEPFSGLDPLAGEELAALLGGLVSEGRTLIIATHRLDAGAALAQRTLVLSAGCVVHDAPTGDPAAFAATYRALIVGDAPPLPPTPLPPLAEPARPAPSAPPGGALAQIWALLLKDLRAEMHTREVLGALFVFAILALLIFGFALDLHGEAARAAAPGILWSAVVFAGTLGLNRSLAREHQGGALEGLLLSPVPRLGILFGKATANLLLMLAVEAVLLPLGAVLFDAPLLDPRLLPVMLLGTLGYAVTGTLLAAMAAHTRSREVLLPILLLPLTVPLLIAAVRATEGLVAGAPWAGVAPWWRLLVAYDLIMVAVSMVTFEFIVES